jgi:hypothetical protein
MKITLKNLHEKTELQVVEYVRRFLLEQRERSLTEEGDCAYRAGELKCAAGCLIAEDEYNPMMEENVWRKLVKDRLVPSAHSDIIQILQNIHDNYPVEAWPKAFEELEEQIKRKTGSNR